MGNKLIARLVLMYGSPEVDNPEAWVAEMDRLVKGYAEKELDKAADIVLRSHRGNRFPSVSEMLTACEDAREQLVPRPVINSYTKWPEWAPDVITAADEMIRCPMGRKAANEGWVFALHTFCRKQRRLPQNQQEISGCIAEARGFDEAYANNAATGDPLGLNRLGDSMLRMRGFLAEVANGRIRSKDELRALLEGKAA